VVAVRNVAVAQGRLTISGYQLVFTVPAANHLILKVAHVFNAATATTITGHVRLQTAAGTSFAILDDFSLAPQAWTTWSGWTVLNPADGIYVQIDGQPVDYWLAGALLPFA
jgi:hypothetical protein